MVFQLVAVGTSLGGFHALTTVLGKLLSEACSDCLQEANAAVWVSTDVKLVLAACARTIDVFSGWV